MSEADWDYGYEGEDIVWIKSEEKEELSYRIKGS